ncbi:glycosyltransferase family 2 protein [Klebsiella aerogenes]|uniref:glycosyltransferase n=1 Tax=Klebsiella aerogenes TaxID=548 RepID=UPI00292CF646|nr:glycosyltransferase [Klebsiella aerogenes]
MKSLLIVPTYNGGDVWGKTAKRVSELLSSRISDVYIIDSESKDNTATIAKAYGFNVDVISANEFNHGGTRNKAVNKNSEGYEIAIFLTQDAIPQTGFIDKIVKIFENPQVACAYGKQLPHDDANPIAKHARYFNYPNKSHIASFEDKSQFGIKTVFSSNSFAAYRVSSFLELGGFPENCILSEDMFFAAKAVMAGYKVAYVHDAEVKHSHNYSLTEEFKRYFDIGVFHAQEPWIRKEFGGAGNEGKNFVKSEIIYLIKNNVLYIPRALMNNGMKLIGYKLGQHYKFLPRFLIKKVSMHKRFWK